MKLDELLKPFEGEHTPYEMRQHRYETAYRDDAFYLVDKDGVVIAEELNEDAGRYIVHCVNTNKAKTELAALVPELVEVLDELEADRVEVDARYKDRNGEVNPAVKHRYERDIKPYDDARELINKAQAVMDKIEQEG